MNTKAVLGKITRKNAEKTRLNGKGYNWHAVLAGQWRHARGLGVGYSIASR